MKKLLLIPALLSSLALANDYDFEFTPLIGYNIAEGNLNLKNETLFGAEFQYTGCDYKIKPELSVLFADGVKSKDITPSASTDMYRVALNGVYEFDNEDKLTPFVKAGIGYENVDKRIAENKDNFFVDTGAGIKYKIADAIALKAEAIYSLKHNARTAGANMGDSNLALLAGVTFFFGEKAQPEAPIAEVVDGDDDNDGVKNSMDKCLNTPSGDVVDKDGCTVDGDDDNDGVKNSLDKCPTTPAGGMVDFDGCCLDNDHDGVKNSKDECPNTPKGTVVDEKGCEKIIDLHVKFENNSYVVDESSLARVLKFAKFLKDFPQYNAEIIGHTNSIGKESANQILSENRANAVRDIIIKQGVEAQRVTAVGKGESSPMASNETEEGLAQNRRIEATLSK